MLVVGITVALIARRWVLLLAAVAGTAITARLGFWQLDRAAQKNALQATLDTRRVLPVLAERDLARDAAAAPAQFERRIALEGRWLSAATVFLDNRAMNGRAGFVVLTPLMLSDGSAVIVQRGWQPRDAVDRTKVVMPVVASDQAHVQGHIAAPPSRLVDFGDAGSGAIRQNVDLAAFARELKLPLRPVSVVQDEDPKPIADGLLRQWPRPAIDVHKHYGYAFQWFAMATLIAGLYVWFQMVRVPRAS